MRRLPLGLVPLLVLVVAWEMTARAGVYSNALFPAPAEVASVFIDEWRLLLRHTEASVLRVVVGVGLAFITAVPLGLVVGRYPTVDRLMDWTIQIFRCFPAIALIPLAIMFFGIGDRPAIVLIWFASFWPLLISTIFGVRNVERTLLAVAQVARASDLLVLRDILLPNALPSILTGFRLATGAGWLTVVTAEMMAVKSGLGYMILYAQMVFRPDEVVAGILIIGTIGLVFDQMIHLLRRYFCRWQDGLVMAP
ncbi:ABC transporter permease [Acidisphaera sp. L21]|uniref:ABC transporter permease n=1 Tax=Acidisphaera sp. L21 TaxID=1641851 RepID=UPI00131BFFB0|nr:ABC transporter permease [Acidisphaera sp. L21]